MGKGREMWGVGRDGLAEEREERGRLRDLERG